MSRLDYDKNNSANIALNLENAEAQIRDVDIAEEAAKMLREQIKQQAAAGILSQINQNVSIALSLL